MNHCLIQAKVKTEPQMRYTKENQTPIAEMVVEIKGLRGDDPLSELKILGWGTIAQEMVDSFPEAYSKEDKEDSKYYFNPSGMVVYLMKAIQELEAEVAALKAG